MSAHVPCTNMDLRKTRPFFQPAVWSGRHCQPARFTTLFWIHHREQPRAELTYMKPYVPGTGLKALHSLFHLIVMITCKVDSHSHFKAKKTGTERVNNLPKTTHLVRLELELKAGQDHRAMLPPVNHHKGASCPCPLQLKVCFIFSPRGVWGGTQFTHCSFPQFLSEC